MSLNSVQLLTNNVSCSLGYSYITTNEEIQVIDFEINTDNGSSMNLTALINSMNFLLRNQEILVNSINTLFQNQKIMMHTIAEIREWKMKCSTLTLNSDNCKTVEETTHFPQMPLTTLK